jgi:hypothetical protein
MQNLSVHLGLAPRFLLGASPRGTRASPLSLPLGPTRSAPARHCLNSNAPPTCIASGSRPAGTRSGPGTMTPSRAAWHFRGWTPPLFSFPLCHAADRAAQSATTPAHPHPRHRPAPATPLERRLPPHHFCACTTASGHRKPLLHMDSGRAPPPSATPR